MKSDKKITLITGPCSAENREQVLTTARLLIERGEVDIFRAGVWKPRTMPGGFEGVGEEGLEWLREVQEVYKVPVATEVATPSHLSKALDAGIRYVWVGARTATDPFATQALADQLKREIEKNPRLRKELTVWVKNPVNPDINLWVGAIKRIESTGIVKIGAIHRGFSVYGKNIYRNMPEWRVATELKLRYPQMPLIFDPSHIGGKREYILPLSEQAIALGYHNLMIECHCNPEKALSDKEQQITPTQLSEVLERLQPRIHTCVDDSVLEELRSQIDIADMELLEVLAKRMKISQEIGKYKREHEMAVVQPKRYNDVLQTRIDAGATMGLNHDFLRKILLAIHDESVRQQLPETDK